MATMRDALTEEPRQADISQRGDNPGKLKNNGHDRRRPRPLIPIQNKDNYPEGNAQCSRYLEFRRRARNSSDVIARHGQPNISATQNITPRKTSRMATALTIQTLIILHLF